MVRSILICHSLWSVGHLFGYPFSRSLFPARTHNKVQLESYTNQVRDNKSTWQWTLFYPSQEVESGESSACVTYTYGITQMIGYWGTGI